MSLRSMGVMNVLCSPSTTAWVISSHSCSICLTRSACDSRLVGFSTISRKARQPSTVFFPWCSKWGKKDASWGSNRMARDISEGRRETKQQLVLEHPLGGQGLDRLRRPAPIIQDVVDRHARERPAPVVHPGRAGDDAGGGPGGISQRRLVVGQVFL